MREIETHTVPVATRPSTERTTALPHIHTCALYTGSLSSDCPRGMMLKEYALATTLQ
jgi:hypothetical protein